MTIRIGNVLIVPPQGIQPLAQFVDQIIVVIAWLAWVVSTAAQILGTLPQ